MKIHDYQSAKEEILSIKKGLRTAKTNLAQMKKEDPVDEEKVKKQEDTVKRFKARLNNAEEKAKEFQPSFFKRTKTWIGFAVITTLAGIATGAYLLTKKSSDETEEPEGNGDSI